MMKITVQKDYSIDVFEFKTIGKHISSEQMKDIFDIQTISSRTGGGDKSIMGKNKKTYDRLIKGGLINHSCQVNCAPHNRKVYYFVKDGMIAYTELIV